jgi:hypothetical protein
MRFDHQTESVNSQVEKRAGTVSDDDDDDDDDDNKERGKS